ncbi:TetR/AcrR family transcriptional regulator C-terminal domain-containing protein [Saccharothrix variisporea]|uniref:TetR family transcriptional regulator n=1 Tax=Saccharothrix variisporea TaxID=543527 RepID=A0A495XHS0_9PSEU|nr:TetR/AcrR family transcriptional regulator C-terminal domain-containing protein [Saccharothrix variisporea]RKT71138.1 TetR family transcriptional regulator [Saccharothrix variisporea]
MGLGRDTIVRAALALLDDVGLDGLTLRRLADELDVQAPALYWHVKNKAELLHDMAAAIVHDALHDLEAPRRGESWVDWTADCAHRLRDAMRTHRDGARVLSGTYLTHLSGRPLELALRTLCDAGFSARDAARGIGTVFSYVQGFTVEEQSTPQPPVDATRFPLAAHAVTELTHNPDARFEHGLRLLLSGLRLSRFGG